MSRVELAVATTPSDNTTNIYIGRAAPTEDIDMSEETLGFDGYIVKTIKKDIILKLIPRFQDINATIIVSGLLSTEYKTIETLCQKKNFYVKEKIIKGEWTCIVLK